MKIIANHEERDVIEAIVVKNWTKYQNIDVLEKQRIETNKRVGKHRAKKKLEEEKKNSGCQSEEPHIEENDQNDNDDFNSITNEVLEDNVSSNNIVTPCNVTVMDKIKSKKKNENEKEKKIESDNKNCDVDISNACRELMRYYENITGRCNGIDYGKLRLSVNIHGEINVKNAIDKVVMFEGESICVKCRKKIGKIWGEVDI